MGDARGGTEDGSAADRVNDLDQQFVELLGLLDGDTALRRIVDGVPESLGVDLAWIGLPEADGRLVLSYVVRATTPDVAGLVVARDIGLGGQVLARRRPLWVRNYVTAPQITHDFAAQAEAEGLRAMLAVPIVHGDQLLGVLYGANRYESEFADRTIRALGNAARCAAAATVVAERARHAAEVAAYEERRRVALGLHDTVGAMLYTIGAGIRRLGLDLADCSPQPGIRQRLANLEQQATEAAAALRGSLRALTKSPEQVALGVAMREDAGAFQERTGVSARVLTLTDLPAVDPSRIAALSEVTREALLNVEKHAGARSVVVSLFATDGGICVSVADDGVGLADGGVTGDGLGLAAAAETVGRLGGELSVVQSDEGGVNVRAWIPG